MALVPNPRRADLGRQRVPATLPRVARDTALPAQGYRLTVTDDGVSIDAADDAGAFYARQTYTQLAREYDGMLPHAHIEDWPDIAVRGVMLDVSRDKVPTMDTLRQLVPRLASLKLNHLQLYIEHTFAYAGHEEVWADASPFTGDEIDELDKLCREHHIELTPNQNCLGHMERWLRLERYRPLAIAPDGWEAGGRLRPPTTIDPAKPESLALVADLLAQLTAHFSSRRVHVGLDEPWELPAERFGDYLAFVEKVRALPELASREVLLWGDIVAHHPEHIGNLPEGVSVCEWGYDADHPFDERVGELDRSGRPFWVCPGTSSWLSLVGRWPNAKANIRNAALAGPSAAASPAGFLVTDWGDMGHLQHLTASDIPLAFAAAQAWCAASNGDARLDIAAAASAHVFEDPTGQLAAGALAMASAQALVTPQPKNRSPLCSVLYHPHRPVGDWITPGMTADEVAAAAAAIGEGIDRVRLSRSHRADADLAVAELSASGELLLLLCRDAELRLAGDGTLASVAPVERRHLAARLEPMVDRHRELWLARNRPGGLTDSVARLEKLRAAYLA